MGLFHCVSSGCAEVRYQRYTKAGGIRYRYPGEEWITVDDVDDFEVNDNRQGQCTGKYRYSIAFDCQTIDASGRPGYQTNRRHSIYFRVGQKIVDPSNPIYFDSQYSTGSARHIFAYANGVYLNGRQVRNQVDTGRSNDGFLPSTLSNVEIQLYYRPDRYREIRLDASRDNCGDCTLKIFKDEEIVFERTENDCPEIEMLSNSECELSDRTQVIRIEKTPFLRRVEVTDYDYQNFGANLFRRDIPDNCLVVRNGYTATIPPLPGGVPTPSNSPLNQDYNYGFVAQICSDEGCPPPEYEVICTCEGEECPPDTCPVECNGTVCCYDPSMGIAVDEIPLENYRGGGL